MFDALTCYYKRELGAPYAMACAPQDRPQDHRVWAPRAGTRRLRTAATHRCTRSCPGMLSQGGQGGRPARLASRLHRVPTPLPIEFAWGLMAVTYIFPPWLSESYHPRCCHGSGWAASARPVCYLPRGRCCAAAVIGSHSLAASHRVGEAYCQHVPVHCCPRLAMAAVESFRRREVYFR
jgi:hypothetical protein